MVCPVCKEAMVAYEWEGVEIDSCAVCGGVWLDAGEVEIIAGLAGVERGEVSAALAGARGPRHANRRCPRCGRKLRTISVGARQRVELDSCPDRHGLWFDRGEVREFVGSFDCGESGAVADYLAKIFGAAGVRNDASGE